MRCRAGIYFNTGHTGCGCDFWSHLQPHLCSRCKVHSQHEIPEGGSCRVVSNLYFAINSSPFLRQLGARCSPMPAPFSIQWANWVILAVLPRPLDQVSQPSGLCGQTALLSLILKELKRTRMFSH